MSAVPPGVNTPAAFIMMKNAKNHYLLCTTTLPPSLITGRWCYITVKKTSHADCVACLHWQSWNNAAPSCDFEIACQHSRIRGMTYNTTASAGCVRGAFDCLRLPYRLPHFYSIAPVFSPCCEEGKQNSEMEAKTENRGRCREKGRTNMPWVREQIDVKDRWGRCKVESGCLVSNKASRWEQPWAPSQNWMEIPDIPCSPGVNALQKLK